MNDIGKAIELLLGSGFSVTSPTATHIYLVDRGKNQPMTTRKTLDPKKKNQFGKIEAHRVALVRLDELEWIDFPAIDFNKDGE